MRIEVYISQIGDRAAGKLFGVSQSTAQAWRTRRRIPRPEKAKEIERITQGKVKFNECY